MLWPFKKEIKVENVLPPVPPKVYEVSVAPGQEANVANGNSISLKVKCVGGKYSGYTFDVIIVRYPTGNCQVHSVAYMNNILQYTESCKEDANAILRNCYAKLNMSSPRLAIADVKQQWCAGVDKCFNVLTKTPYKSTNGSDMCLYLINLHQ